MQQHFDFFEKSFEKKEKTAPSFSKTEKVFDNIKAENTLKHVYRFQTLYKIMSYIYFLTINNPLSCLTYYQDENDYFAELNNTWQLDIKERVLQHIHLIRQIRKGFVFDSTQPTFVFDNDFEAVSLFQQLQI